MLRPMLYARHDLKSLMHVLLLRWEFVLAFWIVLWGFRVLRLVLRLRWSAVSSLMLIVSSNYCLTIVMVEIFVDGWFARKWFRDCFSKLQQVFEESEFPWRTLSRERARQRVACSNFAMTWWAQFVAMVSIAIATVHCDWMSIIDREY